MGKRSNGSGSLSFDKRRGLWRVRVTLNTPDGPKRKNLPSTRTKTEGQRSINEALSFQGRMRLLSDPTRLTLRAYLEEWLSGTVRANNVPESADRIRRDVEIRICPVIGDVKLQGLKALHVRRVKEAVLDSGYASSTTTDTMTTLSMALKQAVADEMIPRNPAENVAKPKERKEGMKVLTFEQCAALIAHVRGTEHEAFYDVALSLGLRSGELRALRWSDMDSEALHIRRSVVGPSRRISSTKTGKERKIRLPERLTASLQRHRARQNSLRLASTDWVENDLMFSSPGPRLGHSDGRLLKGGEYLPHNSCRTRLLKHLQEAGLPRIRFHDLRHTAATMLLRNGVDIRTTADILGHANPAITLQRYAHVLTEMQEKAALAIESYNWS